MAQFELRSSGVFKGPLFCQQLCHNCCRLKLFKVLQKWTNKTDGFAKEYDLSFCRTKNQFFSHSVGNCLSILIFDPPFERLLQKFCPWQRLVLRGSGCGSVGRAVASKSRGPQFKSSHWQTFILNIYCQLYWKDENKKRLRIAHLKKISLAKTFKRFIS